MMDLFTPIVAKERLHHNFLATIKDNAVGVREVVAGWAEGFVDRDGKLVEEFQTTYNSSFWELYLFAVLKHLKIKIDFSFDSPDFVAAQHPFAIEAAIASHAQDDVPEWEKTIEGITDTDIEAAQLQSTLRLSNAFVGKSEAYKKRYAALPHMAKRSFVVAIANFGRQDFNLLGDFAMGRLLYDPEKKKQVHKANGAVVPLGLFNSDSYAHISAVLFSCVATFGKTRALGKHEGEFVFFATRLKKGKPVRIIARNTDYIESLTDGLKLFVNPYATTPIDPELFADPGIFRLVVQKDGNRTWTDNPDGDLASRIVQAFFKMPRLRTVKHTYDAQGRLAERTVLSGLHRSRESAVAEIKAVAQKNRPFSYDDKTDRWQIMDKAGKSHFLFIETALV